MFELLKKRGKAMPEDTSQKAQFNVNAEINRLRENLKNKQKQEQQQDQLTFEVFAASTLQTFGVSEPDYDYYIKTIMKLVETTLQLKADHPTGLERHEALVAHHIQKSFSCLLTLGFKERANDDAQAKDEEKRLRVEFNRSFRAVSRYCDLNDKARKGTMSLSSLNRQSAVIATINQQEIASSKEFFKDAAINYGFVVGCIVLCVLADMFFLAGAVTSIVIPLLIKAMGPALIPTLITSLMLPPAIGTVVGALLLKKRIETNAQEIEEAKPLNDCQLFAMGPTKEEDNSASSTQVSELPDVKEIEKAKPDSRLFVAKRQRPTKEKDNSTSSIQMSELSHSPS